MTSNPSTRFAQLEQWFSSPRMSTYRRYSEPEAFYIWNTRLSKAYLEDIQHVEVLLRNRIDNQLSDARGPRWFEDDSYFRFTDQFRKAVTTAKRRAGARHSPGKIIAELTFDTWGFLLARRYKTHSVAYTFARASQSGRRWTRARRLRSTRSGGLWSAQPMCPS